MAIKSNLEEIRQNILQAAVRAGRSVSSIHLIGVTKTVAVERVIEAIEAGVQSFGENRVQEALPKMEQIRTKGYYPEWHFIGKAQRNKVRMIVGRFCLIHSVDSFALAEEISQQSEKQGITQEILLEINLSREATKIGFTSSEALSVADRINRLKYVKLKGLMTVPSLASKPADSRPIFKSLRQLGAQIEERLGRPLGFYSMGMSNDYQVAIEEGATHIRLGRALFGDRPN